MYGDALAESDRSISQLRLMTTVRHAPSREVWKLCLDRLRQLRGPNVPERDLAALLGFEPSRTNRWKNGEMYVDRAEHLMRLAAAIDIDAMVLVAVAAGSIGAEEALRQLVHPRAESASTGKSLTSGIDPARVKISADSFCCEIDPKPSQEPARGIVLLISSSAEGRVELASILKRYPGIEALVSPSFSTGLLFAERSRPELILLDLGLAGAQAFEACHTFAGLTSGARYLCRVIAGTSNLTDAIKASALLAGAASVVLFPFTAAVMKFELDRVDRLLRSRQRGRPNSGPSAQK